MVDVIDVNDLKAVTCAMRAAFGVGITEEAESLADDVLRDIANNPSFSPAVQWVLRCAANMSTAKPESRPRSHLTVIEGGAPA